MTDYCLYCHKALDGGELPYHPSCLKERFHDEKLPFQAELSYADESSENIKAGMAVPGEGRILPFAVNKRFSAYLLIYPDKNDPLRVEGEHLLFSLAKIAGIKVPTYGYYQTREGLALLIKRIDLAKREKVGFEDFASLLGRIAADKREGAYEEAKTVLERYSAYPGLDKAEYAFRLLFAFLTGDNDLHFKKFALIETKNGHYRLAPACLLSSAAFNNGPDELALSLNGKKQGLGLADLKRFALSLGLTQVMLPRLISRLLAHKEEYIQTIEDSLLEEKSKEKLRKLLEERAKILLGE